ncbi:hypothetical protein UlMin_024032 [Ulmus minor]
MYIKPTIPSLFQHFLPKQTRPSSDFTPKSHNTITPRILPKPVFRVQLVTADEEWGPEKDEPVGESSTVAVAEEEKPVEIAKLKKALVDSLYGTDRGISFISQDPLEVKRELDEFDQLNGLLDADSLLFRKSFEKIKSSQMKKLVINLLLRLASGWRPKKRNIDITYLYLVCSVEVVMEDWYMQILRVWDLLPLVDIPKLAKHLDTVFGSYIDDFLSFCKVKCLEG